MNYKSAKFILLRCDWSAKFILRTLECKIYFADIEVQNLFDILLIKQEQREKTLKKKSICVLKRLKRLKRYFLLKTESPEQKYHAPIQSM